MSRKKTPQTYEKRRREHEKQQRRLAKIADRRERSAAKKLAREQTTPSGAAGQAAPSLAQPPLADLPTPARPDSIAAPDRAPTQAHTPGAAAEPVGRDGPSGAPLHPVPH